jgi:predicted  nucleic acid-binding Zn-ribbon protein
VKQLEEMVKTEQNKADGVAHRYEAIDRTIGEKDNMIAYLNSEKNEFEIRSRKHLQEYKELYNNHQEFLLTYEKVCSENDILKNNVFRLENELNVIKSHFEETQERYSQYEVNYRKKDMEIASFKEHFDTMKKRQLEIGNVLELFEQENINLKQLLNEKKLYIEDLTTRIENLKLEFQDKIMMIEKDYDQTRLKNHELQNKIDNILKIKIRALKSKLKEKIEIITELEKKFQYEREKRG